MTMSDPIAEYQSLLTADESLAALDRAVDLARSIALGGVIIDHQRWPALTADGSGTYQLTNASASARRVSDVAHLLKSLPPRAEKSDVPEAQYALLMDVLILVFHQAYFLLLRKAATAQRRTLLEALDAFADKLPNLPDRFQAKGLLHLERGDVEQAAQEFDAALAATASEQHDFMTRVQMLWSLLMEHHQLEAAFSCLMRVSPRVTRLDYDELQGLLKETFEEALQH